MCQAEVACKTTLFCMCKPRKEATLLGAAERRRARGSADDFAQGGTGSCGAGCSSAGCVLSRGGMQAVENAGDGVDSGDGRVQAVECRWRVEVGGGAQAVGGVHR